MSAKTTSMAPRHPMQSAVNDHHAPHTMGGGSGSQKASC